MSQLADRISSAIAAKLVDLQTRGQAVLLNDPIGDRQPAIAAKTHDARTMQSVNKSLWQGWEDWEVKKH